MTPKPAIRIACSAALALAAGIALAAWGSRLTNPSRRRVGATASLRRHAHAGASRVSDGSPTRAAARNAARGALLDAVAPAIEAEDADDEALAECGIAWAQVASAALAERGAIAVPRDDLLLPGDVEEVALGGVGARANLPV